MPDNTDNPLSSYIERLPQVKRIFHLHKDRVEVDASWTLGKDHHMTVRLETLAPQVKRFFVRNRWFKRSIMIGSLAVAAAIVFTRGDYPDWVKRNALLGWLICGGCVIMAFLTYRKREFARFNRKDGRPGLDICSAGPDTSRFEEFVQQVQKRIRNA